MSTTTEAITPTVKRRRKRKRPVFLTDEQRHEATRQYRAAPNGTKARIARRWNVSVSTIDRWLRRGYGTGEAVTTTAPATDQTDPDTAAALADIMVDAFVNKKISANLLKNSIRELVTDTRS